VQAQYHVDGRNAVINNDDDIEEQHISQNFFTTNYRSRKSKTNNQ